MTRLRATFVAVLALSTALAAQAPGSGRGDTEVRRVNDRIAALQSEANNLAGQARTLLGDLRKLEIEREVQEERVREAQAAIVTGRAAIDAAAARMASLDAQRVAQLPNLQTQLVDLYKRGRAGYLTLLFESNGVREFGRATRAMAALMRLNERRLADHQQTVVMLQQERAGLEEEFRALQARETEALEARTAADRALAARTALMAQIDRRRDLNAQLAGELQVAYARLQQQVANLGSGRGGEAVAIPLAPFRGTLEWPVPGPVTGRFGQRTGTAADAPVRDGIEIAAAADAPVRALHPGTVSFAEPFTGFGNLVIVDHGADTYSLYGYLSAILVTRGDAVESGTEVGRAGTAPAGAPAVYLEIRIDGRSVDPVQWLKPR